jgi:hypothetical protein
MKRFKLLPTLALSVAIGACAQDSDSNDGATGLRSAMAAGAFDDVATVKFIIESCAPGAYRQEFTEELELETLPGNFDEFKNTPLAEGSTHLFADHFQVLEPGCYNVYAQPLQASGAHSAICADAWKNGLIVKEGETTETFMISQCEGHDPGALDAILAINHEPTLVDVYFDKSKFVCDEQAAVCALGADVDGDPISYDFVAPVGCTFGPQYADGSDGHAGYVCAQVECVGPARYDFAVKVYDMAVKDGAPIRLEDWLDEEGYPNESHAQLIAPIYFEKKGVCSCEGKDIDVVFLQDRSGSFQDDIATVDMILPGIESELALVAAHARFGAAAFIDKDLAPFGGHGDYIYRFDLALGASAGGAYPGTASGGADTKESQLDALMQVALNSSSYGFAPTAFKYVVLMSDALYHRAGDCGPHKCTSGANNGDTAIDLREDYASVDQLRSALTAAGIVPVFAVTLPNVAGYQGLVDALGFGKVVELSTDSSNLRSVLVDGLSCE